MPICASKRTIAEALAAAAQCRVTVDSARMWDGDAGAWVDRIHTERTEPRPMTKHARNLAAARDGYAGAEFNHEAHGMLTSELHAAFCTGQHMRDTGRTEPNECRPGRGDRVHCNGLLFKLDWRSVRHPTITREA